MAVRSMTGYGAADGGFDGEGGTGRWRWELKAVNGRSLDLKLRLPTGFDRLDMRLREVAQRLRRGSIHASLTVTRERGGTRLVIDDAVLADVSAAVAKLRLAVECTVPSADGLLRIPGLLVTEQPSDGETALDPQATDVLVEGFAAAAAALTRTREREGEKLATAVADQCRQLASLVEEARAEATAASEAMAQQLRQRMASLSADIGPLDEGRLAQEAAALAVKADVTEEIDRLTAHIAAVRAALDTDEPVGRRLDFLAQELAREASTLSVKAASQRLNEIGLSLKLVIDRMREQVQNIL